MEACALQYVAGRVERCPGLRCPLWDQAGGACALAALTGDLVSHPPLAQYLLELRMCLDQARSDGRSHERRLFYRLLNEEQAAEVR